MQIPVFDNSALLAENKARITALVEGAVQPIVEVVVPKALAAELSAWVETFGVRCAVIHGFKIVDGAQKAETQLVISLDKAPVVPEPPPVEPEGGNP